MDKQKCKEIFNRISPKPPTIDELCDKASHHCYDLIYPQLLEPYFNKKINLLEIGVYRGGSMLIWKEVFPDSNLVGVDWDYKNLKVNLEDVELITSSQTNIYLPNLLKQKKFDIIIDDASHQAEDQIKTFNLLKTYVNQGGIYIIEDIYPEHFQNNKYSKKFLENFEFFDYTPKSGRGDDKLLVYKNN